MSGIRGNSVAWRYAIQQIFAHWGDIKGCKINVCKDETAIDGYQINLLILNTHVDLTNNQSIDELQEYTNEWEKNSVLGLDQKQILFSWIHEEQWYFRWCN